MMTAKPFRETFESPFEVSYERAVDILENIRKSHPESSGWYEISFEIKPVSNGKFKAIRVHEKRN